MEEEDKKKRIVPVLLVHMAQTCVSIIRSRSLPLVPLPSILAHRQAVLKEPWTVTYFPPPAMDEAEVAGCIFDRLDVCKDLLVSKGELQLVDVVMNHQPLDIDQSDRRVQQLFAEIDLNKDNHISRDEWLANWDKICAHMPGIKDSRFRERMNQLFDMSGPQVAPLYAKGGVSTFFHKPLYGRPGERPPADCVFFGCPFDAGSTYRAGSRFGPKAIREASQMLVTNGGNDYAPWMDKNFGKMRVFDAGDTCPTPFDLITAVNQIYVFTKVLWNTSCKVVAIGGDHTLSWSFLAAARDRNHGEAVAVIHLDAHLDTGTEYLGSKLSHGTALGRAGATGCIDFHRSTHIGIRGISEGTSLQEHSDSLGYRTISMDKFVELGPVEAAKVVKKRAGAQQCVIILDLDVMDTSDCPGVGLPTPGGLRNRELLAFLRALRGLLIMGGAIVEYTPAHDPAQATALIAAQAGYEIMALALDTMEIPCTSSSKTNRAEKTKALGQTEVSVGTGKEKEDTVKVHKINYLEKDDITKMVGKKYYLIGTGKRKRIKEKEIDDKKVRKSEKTVKTKVKKEVEKIIENCVEEVDERKR